MNEAVVEATADGFRVRGVVDHDNAEGVMQAGFARMRERGDLGVSVDLSTLESDVGSVAVALMMSWFRFASSADIRISFASLTNSLAKIVDFSGLNAALPVCSRRGSSDAAPAQAASPDEELDDG